MMHATLPTGMCVRMPFLSTSTKAPSSTSRFPYSRNTSETRSLSWMGPGGGSTSGPPQQHEPTAERLLWPKAGGDLRKERRRVAHLQQPLELEGAEADSSGAAPHHPVLAIALDPHRRAARRLLVDDAVIADALQGRLHKAEPAPLCLRSEPGEPGVPRQRSGIGEPLPALGEPPGRVHHDVVTVHALVLLSVHALSPPHYRAGAEPEGEALRHRQDGRERR